VSPYWLGLPEGATEGCSVGMGEIVGRGEIVGVAVGVEEGAGEAVGPELGDAVGLDVTKRWQAVDVASIQVGLNESNCSIVSNTEENGQRTPLLLLTKF